MAWKEYVVIIYPKLISEIVTKKDNCGQECHYDIFA